MIFRIYDLNVQSIIYFNLYKPVNSSQHLVMRLLLHSMAAADTPEINYSRNINCRRLADSFLYYIYIFIH